MPDPCYFRAAFLSKISGLLPTVVALVTLRLLCQTAFAIHNPAPIYLTTVVYATFSGGFVSGGMSAAIILLDIFYSTPHQLLQGAGNVEPLILLVTTSAIVLMVSFLKQRAEQALKLQLANESLQQQVKEYQRQETQLRQENERFGLAAAVVKGIIYDWDIENNQLKRTQGLAEVLGFSPEEAEPTPEWWAERIHPEDLQRANQQVWQAIANEDSYTIEYRIRNQENQYLYVWDRGLIFRNNDGQAVRVVGCTLDVTARKQAEELQQQLITSLQESEDRYRQLVELSPDTVIVQSEDKIAFSNSAGAKLLGAADPEQLIGTPIFEVLHSDYHEIVQQRIRQVRGGITVPLLEQKYIRLDGTLVDVEVAASPFIYQGKPASQIVVRDITERKQMEARQRELMTSLQLSEERFRIAAHSATDLIYEWDIGNNHRKWFGKIDEQLGYELNEFPRTLEAWKNALHPDDRKRVMEAIERHLQTQVPYCEEYRIQRKDGVYLYWMDTGTALWDEAGNPYKWIGVNTNVTERKLYEARIKRLVDSNIIGIVVANLSGQVIETNDAFLRIVGYTQEEALAGTVLWSEITPPEYASEDARANREVRATGICPPFEKEYIRKDGSRVSVLVGLALLEGTQEECVAFVLDLTERRKVEAERAQLLVREQEARTQAEASEQRYRFLAESIPQIVWTAQADGCLDYWNQRWFDYTGLTCEESLGWKWQNVLHPDDQPLYVYSWNQALKTGQRYELEVRVKRAIDGVYRWHLVRGLPMHDKNGQIVKWFGTCTDIDQQKRTEQALLFLSEASKLLASSIDYETTLSQLAHLAVPHLADYCLVHMTEENQSLRQVAVAHVDSAKAAWLCEMQHRYPANLKLYDIYQVFRTGESELYSEIAESQLLTITQDSEHLQFLKNFRSAMVVPLVARERTLGVLTFLTAESNRRYSSEDLAFADELAHRAALAVDNARLYCASEAALKTAQEANRLKDEFLATLSHELRTPLNSILGWSKLLYTRKYDEATTARALETIERNARLQHQLIEDILDVSRIIQGKLSLKLYPVELVPVIEAALDIMRPTAEAKAIQVETVYHQLSSWVSADANRLQQIVWNLLNNAIKFTPTGGRVTVELRQTDNYAQIRVIDTGKGIRADFLPYVFDRFRQADSSSTRSQGGLGLGLAIVRHLVELHGGTVGAESPGEGLGATFTVQLPLSASKPRELESQRTGESTSQEELGLELSHSVLIQSSTSLPLKGLQILVVDDEADTRELLALELKQQGAKVTSVASVREALSVLPNSLPDVLISDIGMPELDGYALIQKLRNQEVQNAWKIPALALSAYAREEDQQQALAAGFHRHIAKPVDPAQLVEVIVSLLEELQFEVTHEESFPL